MSELVSIADTKDCYAITALTNQVYDLNLFATIPLDLLLGVLQRISTSRTYGFVGPGKLQTPFTSFIQNISSTEISHAAIYS